MRVDTSKRRVRFPVGPNINLFTSSDFIQWPNEPPYSDAGGARTGENPTLTIIEFFVTPFDNWLWTSQEESQISDRDWLQRH